jgi:hypothetical protein
MSWRSRLSTQRRITRGEQGGIGQAHAEAQIRTLVDPDLKRTDLRLDSHELLVEAPPLRLQAL